VFTKNRERLIEGDIAAQFMAAVLNQERVTALLSDEHFSVDGTLMARNAAMRRTPRPPIAMPGCTARGRASRPGWPIWSMF